MKILVITSEPDGHLPLVQQHLDQDLIVFDPYLIPTESDITYRWDPKQQRFDIFSGGSSLSDVDAVWYRKPRLLPEEEMPVAEYSHKPYAHSSYQHAFEMISGLMKDKLWVNKYWSIKSASNKLLQLEVAARLGINVPDTLVTSDPVMAEEFVRSHPVPIVTKMTGIKHLYEKDISYVFYTSDLEDNPDFSGLYLDPCFFQVKIEKSIDLRVNVVGDQVFACEIHQHGDHSGSVDWRTGIFEPQALSYAPHEWFPQDLAERCRMMLQQLGLIYGAFDFVLDKEGVYWFVEVNPNGQWGFVEEETGILISKAFVDVFARGKQ